MKLTYQKRTGHERTRFAHTSTNAAATARRESALKRLEAQLKTGTKTEKGPNGLKLIKIPLTTEDITRIKKEIAILNTKTNKTS